ncbi:MAG: hypothetical protein IT229_01610 [Flavobacteriales bacterium]|nr:hypothetical protein [Flavobacteriales bacterium]
MSERHPIDELFHRVLQDAEVTPPPAVWEGIVRKRTKRRGGYWGWLAAGLLLLGCAGAFLIHNDHGTPMPIAELQGSSGPNKNIATAGTEPAAIGATEQSASSGTPTTPHQASTQQETPTVAAEGLRPSDQENTSNAVPAVTASTSTVTPGATTSARASAPAAPRHGSTTAVPGSNTVEAVVNTRPTAHDARIVRDVTMNELDLLPLVSPDMQRQAPPLDSMRSGGTQAPYVLPNADWWVALEVGRHNVKRTWYGDEPLLVSALNGVEVPHYTWSLGLLAGRSWRSGFGLSTGLAYEGSEYAYDHLDDRVRVDSMLVVPYLITLDTQVFVSNVDTVTFMTEETKQVSGMNRFSIFRVAIEGYWHKQHRRWTIGVRAGLAAEFVAMRQGYTLDLNDEGDVMSVDLSAQAYDTRYHTTLTAVLGADVGFAMSEHWGLWATPTYMHGITAWGTNGSPFVLPERMGLRVRLSYTFTRIP